MPPRLVPPDLWRPVGIDDLEPAAWAGIRALSNTSVTAGPGAGKTEFLAQRAAYLLQTGTCPPPFRILAISFKRSAARNLADRVRARCTPEQGRRFESWTFDAFAKGLVDRFRNVIPADWRPPADYELVFPSDRDVSAFLGQVRAPNAEWTSEIRGIQSTMFEPRTLGSARLPPSRPLPKTGTAWAILEWWDRHANATGGAQLTMAMVNRLAELLVRSNPQIRGLLRAAYPFVFVDEFQDTTYAQFNLLETMFLGTTTAVTAVGDEKQRIMVWAGARPNAFALFAKRFEATSFKLLFNFRSSPELVRLQNAIAVSLEETAPAAESRVPSRIDGDAAEIWSFGSSSAEAVHLAEWIPRDAAKRGLAPHDYAIVARQRVDLVYDRLAGPFADAGLRLRNETLRVGRLTIQDLMAEPLTDIVLDLFDVAVRRPAPHAWVTAVKSLTYLRAVAPDDEVGIARVDTELSRFVRALRADLESSAVSSVTAVAAGERMIDFLSLGALARSLPEYAVGDGLELAAEALLTYLEAMAVGACTWSECVARLRGEGEIRLQTIHKSKGLEYDTVVFVDLDDYGWRHHSHGDREGISTFFVALSRARQRVVFSHCQQKGREGVSDLYDLLSRAGVPEREW